MNHRSQMFVPGHRPDLIAKALCSDADALVVDLEDAVPPADKDQAREIVHAMLSDLVDADIVTVLVRVNPAGTPECELDLAAVGNLARTIRLPKVSSAADIDWVRERCPSLDIIAAIESAAGLLAAAQIAATPGVVALSLGGVDLATDLGCATDTTALQYAMSHLVVVSRAAGLAGPIHAVYPNLKDEPGLRAHAQAAKLLGFTGQSVLAPRQLPVVHDVFSAGEHQIAWARRVLDTFDKSKGAAGQTDDGEFVDLAVVRQARLLIDHKGTERA